MQPVHNLSPSHRSVKTTGQQHVVTRAHPLKQQQRHIQLSHRQQLQHHYQPQQQQQQHDVTRQQVSCLAWFGLGGSSSSSSSKLSERPLYNKRDMFDLGGMQVSPMGLGTWAWGNK